LTKSDEEVEQLTLVIRIYECVKKLIKRYIPLDFCSTFVLTAIGEEPKSGREIVNSIEGRLWKDAMVKEMESLNKNETCNLVELPNGINLIGNKWVFKKNMNATGQVKKFKAQLIAKGYSQFEGVNFGEIFFPCCKINLH
jgi:hypothetical protein